MVKPLIFLAFLSHPVISVAQASGSQHLSKSTRMGFFTLWKGEYQFREMSLGPSVTKSEKEDGSLLLLVNPPIEDMDWPAENVVQTRSNGSLAYTYAGPDGWAKTHQRETFETRGTELLSFSICNDGKCVALNTEICEEVSGISEDVNQKFFDDCAKEKSKNCLGLNRIQNFSEQLAERLYALHASHLIKEYKDMARVSYSMNGENFHVSSLR